MHARDVLNELKWSRGRLADAVVTYVHRGAPGDVMEVTGGDIREVTHGWLILGPRPKDDATRRGASDVVLEGAHIPWHRILTIALDGEVLWARRSGADARDLDEGGQV